VSQERKEGIFCPRWSQDDAARSGYLQKRYAHKSKHEGIVSYTTNRRVYVLLEPGIEAVFDADSESTVLGIPIADLQELHGTKVTATIGEFDPRRRWLAATALNRSM